MIAAHSNPNSKMKNTLFLVVLFAMAQHIYSQRCQAGKKSYYLLTYLTERLPNPQPNHHHVKSSFQTLVGSCMTTTHP